MPLRLLFSLIIFALAGCAEDNRPLRIGTNVWPGYELFYLARETGLLPEEQVRLVEFPAAADVMDALAVGKLEGAALTLDEAIRMQSRGRQLAVVLVLDISDGADAVLATPAISKLSELSGKRVGVPFESVGLLLLDAALTEASLSMNDIKLVDLAPEDHASALHRGEVDAVVTFEPFLSHIREDGAVSLYDSSAVRGRIVDVLVIRRAVLEAQRDRVALLVRGFLEARTRLHSDRANSLNAMNRRLRMEQPDLESAFHKLHIPGPEENQRLLDENNGRLLRTSEALTTLMIVNGMLTVRPDLNGFITDQFVPE